MYHCLLIKKNEIFIKNGDIETSINEFLETEDKDFIFFKISRMPIEFESSTFRGFHKLLNIFSEQLLRHYFFDIHSFNPAFNKDGDEIPFKEDIIACKSTIITNDFSYDTDNMKRDMYGNYILGEREIKSNYIKINHSQIKYMKPSGEKSKDGELKRDNYSIELCGKILNVPFNIEKESFEIDLKNEKGEEVKLNIDTSDSPFLLDDLINLVIDYVFDGQEDLASYQENDSYITEKIIEAIESLDNKMKMISFEYIASKTKKSSIFHLSKIKNNIDLLYSIADEIEKRNLSDLELKVVDNYVELSYNDDVLIKKEINT